jgi:hypothetical protein
MLFDASELLAGAAQVQVSRGTQHGGTVTVPLEREVESDSSRADGGDAARSRSFAHRSSPESA